MERTPTPPPIFAFLEHKYFVFHKSCPQHPTLQANITSIHPWNLTLPVSIDFGMSLNLTWRHGMVYSAVGTITLHKFTHPFLIIMSAQLMLNLIWYIITWFEFIYSNSVKVMYIQHNQGHYMYRYTIEPRTLHVDNLCKLDIIVLLEGNLRLLDFALTRSVQ